MDLLSYAQSLEISANNRGAPVEQWNPPFRGDIDIVIKNDGLWFYQGTPIKRARLVRLFASVLQRENEDYFLVTPHEKWRIRVEDAPFTAVTMRVSDAGRTQNLTFMTSVGDEVSADAAHAIVFRGENIENAAPYIHVRRGLEARIARAVYYDLVDAGEMHQVGGEETFGVWSDGVFFPFAAGDAVFG